MSPLDMARFIRVQVHAGESNATVAEQLGMNLTIVAHHLALLDLPPELNEAFASIRYALPRGSQSQSLCTRGRRLSARLGIPSGEHGWGTCSPRYRTGSPGRD